MKKKKSVTNKDIKVFNFMPPKHPCRLPHVFSLKNKIFEISWVFEPSELTKRNKKYHIHNFYTTHLQHFLWWFQIRISNKLLYMIYCKSIIKMW